MQSVCKMISGSWLKMKQIKKPIYIEKIEIFNATLVNENKNALKFLEIHAEFLKHGQNTLLADLLIYISS